MSAATDSKLHDALNLLTVIQVARTAGIELKVGAQKSPFREDRKPSFSVLRNQQGWRDHATGEHGSVWAFARLLRPTETVAETARFLIGLAGLADGDEAPVAGTRAVPVMKPTVRKFEHSEEWPATVVYRWNEGQGAVDEQAVARLAARRGWPESFVHRLLALDLISYPLLPWHEYNEARGRRGWAFKVERLGMRKGAVLSALRTIPVGYHQTFEIAQPDGKARKSWLYVPYRPVTPEAPKRLSPFQERLQELDARCAPYPFFMGDTSPTLLVMFEGQWDEATFALAAMGDEPSLPAGVAVLGLRGNQSIEATMECLGGYLRAARPSVWLWPDNDAAGSLWTRGEIGKAPSFRDQLWAAGAARVQTCRVSVGKDMNDLFRAAPFGPDRVSEMARAVGFGAWFPTAGKAVVS